MDKPELCSKQAVVRYTWPGRDEMYSCLDHAEQVKGIASAIGMHLQFIPLAGDDQMKVKCSQVMEKSKEVKGDE